MGKLSLETNFVNFVVCHDLFDNCEGTRVAFKSLVDANIGCQVLVFNYGAQAGCRYPVPTPEEAKHQPPSSVALNNEWCAERLAELMSHIEAQGEMLFSAPFHVLGIGAGFSIAAAFAGRFGRTNRYRTALRSLVSINGYCAVDAQLAAIYHSATKVFSAFPENRPDLPVSYFTKYLFSEGYMSTVHPNLALNIYTAVSNPITLEGRVKMCASALATSDVSPFLAPTHLPVPLVVLQCTENALVNASNVDAFLEGRAANHLWSHQMALEAPNGQSTLGSRGQKMLLDALANPSGAFVMWVRAGHAVRQERKKVLRDLLEMLCNPGEEISDGSALIGNGGGIPEAYVSSLASDPEGSSSGKFLPSQALISQIQTRNDSIEAATLAAHDQTNSDTVGAVGTNNSTSLLIEGSLSSTVEEEASALEATEEKEELEEKEESKDAGSARTSELKGTFQPTTPYPSLPAVSSAPTNTASPATQIGAGGAPIGDSSNNTVNPSSSNKPAPAAPTAAMGADAAADAAEIRARLEAELAVRDEAALQRALSQSKADADASRLEAMQGNSSSAPLVGGDLQGDFAAHAAAAAELSDDPDLRALQLEARATERRLAEDLNQHRRPYGGCRGGAPSFDARNGPAGGDRKSTRLNSSHV